VGASYLYHQTKFAAGFLRSTRKTGFGNTARGAVYNLSVTYQQQPGLDFYVEGFRINTKNSAALYEAQLQAQSIATGSKVEKIRTDQKANVVVLGMKVSF
jgi:predicted porin